MKSIEGKITAQNAKIAIVQSRFNSFITDRLLEGTIDCLVRHDGNEENLDLFKVPGSFEIPLVAQKVTATKKYEAVICLGAVIRGGTPHFDYIANEVTKGIAQVSLHSGIPVIFGILTTDTIEEAIERAGTKMGNKGWEAAMTAMEMIQILKKI
jgi:6,7-dimethyl-8-ribityllumazine synthase